MRRRKRFYKNKVLVVLVLAALLVGGGLTFARFKASQPQTDTNQTAQEEEYINLDPPTEQETREAEENKNSLSEDTPTPPDSTNTKKSVTPVITFASRTEVRAYVSGIFEDGGACTATATKGPLVKTSTSTGFADVNKTTCAPIKNLSLEGGGWSIIVSYSSSTAEGKSQSYEVN